MAHRKEQAMQNPEIVLFIIAAVVAGGLTVGGVTVVYFVD
jgi:hypothetical protein